MPIMIERITDRFMSFLDLACYPLTFLCYVGAAWMVWRALGKIYWGT